MELQNSLEREDIVNRVYLVSTIILISITATSSTGKQNDALSLSNLHDNGAFGFPQKYAQVLCDRSDLRVSVYNSDSSLYVQAILWTDGDDTIGKQKDGKKIGDYSSLMFHFSSKPQRLPQKDRNYLLNPWPSMTGLYFTIVLSEHSTTALRKDAEDRGYIRYISTSDGKRVRVDCYLIPFSDLGLTSNDSIGLCYYGYSPVPELTTNSTRAVGKGHYYSHQIPVSSYQFLSLQKGNSIQIDRLPQP
jgi:hypothetical protein